MSHRRRPNGPLRRWIADPRVPGDAPDRAEQGPRSRGVASATRAARGLRPPTGTFGACADMRRARRVIRVRRDRQSIVLTTIRAQTLVAALALALAVGGCGAAADLGDRSHPDYRAALRGAPPAL